VRRGGVHMSDKDILFVLTICRILGKPVNVAAVLAHYQEAQELMKQHRLDPA
jgi:two-component SAPR family response regulator